MVSPSKKVDPILLAVLDSQFNAINEEMGDALIRTSMNVTFAEVRDLAVAIFDKDARLVAEKEYMPILAGCIPLTVEHVARAHADDVYEGDIFIHNDPFAGNTHVFDVNIMKPVFYEGKLVFWTVCIGHISDLGAAAFNMRNTTTFEDGIIFPALKLHERGRLNKTLYDLFIRNNRIPEQSWGDIVCMIGAVTTGERKLLELVKRYGVQTLYAAIDEILTASEREMRNNVRQVPDGIYYGEKSMDHDSVLRDRPITVRAKITKQGDEITIDLSDSDPQVPGNVNGSWGGTLGACHVILDYELPGTIRKNHGSMVPIKIIARKGTVVNPEFPASVQNASATMPECIQEAIADALSKAIPTYVAAPHAKNHLVSCRKCFNPRTKRRLHFSNFFASCVASGGTEGYDGWDLGGPSMNLGSMRTPDVEIFELVYPIHILRFEQEIDSAGAGKFRGGLGHAHTVEYLVDMGGGFVFGSGMQDYSVPFGMLGGKNPKPTTIIVHRGTGQKEKLEEHSFVEFQAGDIMEIHSMGGAGFGDPFKRDPERVKEDVKNELVSLEAAREVYGVIIDGDTREVDLRATQELRKTHNK